MIVPIVSAVGCAYSLFMVVRAFVARRLYTHTLVQLLLILGFYGQGLRLWLSNERLEPFELGMVWTLIGHAMCEVGWLTTYRFWRARQRRAPSPLQPRQLFTVVAVLTAIGLVSWYVYFAPYGGAANYLDSGLLDQRVILAKGRGYLLILIGWLALGNYLMFSFAMFHWRAERYKWVLYAVFPVHTAVLWAISVPLGQRGGILTPVISWILIATCAQRKMSRKRVAAAGVAIFLLVGILGSLRSNKSLEGRPSVGQFVSSGWGFQMRLDTYTQILAAVPETVEYQWGRTYLALFTRFVPRAMWEDKWDSAGALISERITRSGTYAGLANEQPTMLGEAYLNFSYAGILGVAFAVGLCVGAADKYRDRVADEWEAVIAANWSLCLLGVVNGEFVNAVFRGVIAFLVIIAGRAAAGMLRGSVGGEPSRMHQVGRLRSPAEMRQMGLM